MKNLFKKLLACCMAVCMVLTLCVGAITVGAEAPTGTVTAGTANIYTTDATAVVPVTTYAAGGIAAAEINVKVPANLAISALELVTTDAKVEVTYASAADPSGAPEVLAAGAATSTVAPNVIDGVFTYIIHLPANTVTTAEVTVKITFAGTFAEGTTVVDVVDAEACFDANSDLINLTIVDGAIVVAVAHVCTPGTPVVEKEVPADCDTDGSYDSVIYCTGCGKELSRETFTVKATGHTPGTPVEENRVEPKPGVEGSYDSVVYCTVCSAEVSRTPATIPALPKEAVLDENLQFRDIEVTVTSTVNVKYRVYKNDRDGKRGYKSLGYDSVEIVVTGDQYSFDNANLYNIERIPETVATKTASNNTGDTFLYEGIAMFSLGLNVEAYIKAYDAQGNYVAYSPITTTTPESALRVTLANSTTDGGRASIIELLNMAAAAQEMFAANKKDSDLAKDVAAGKLVNKDLPESVVTEVPTLNVANTNVVWAEGKESLAATHEISASVSLTVSPNIRLTVKGKDKFADSSKVTVDFVYTNPEPGNLDKITTKTLTAADGGTLSKRFNFDIPGFEFHNSNQIVTAKVYYDGELLATAQYSVETFVDEQLKSTTATATAKDMAAAIAKFGLAFRINKGLATA